MSCSFGLLSVNTQYLVLVICCVKYFRKILRRGARGGSNAEISDISVFNELGELYVPNSPILRFNINSLIISIFIGFITKLFFDTHTNLEKCPATSASALEPALAAAPGLSSSQLLLLGLASSRRKAIVAILSLSLASLGALVTTVVTVVTLWRQA